MRILLIAALRIVDAHVAHDLENSLLQLLAAQPLVQANGLADLRTDGFERVQTRHGVLKDHANLFAADFEPILFLLELGQIHIIAVAVLAGERSGNARILIDSIITDGASVDKAVAVEQADQVFVQHRLSAAGLADDGQALARVHIQ